MFRIVHRIFPVAGMLLFLAACKPGVPSDVIPPSTLEDLLYDYHVAQAMAEVDRGDSMDYRRYSYVRAVFDKYGVTEADFDSTMVWYSSHSTYLNDIYKRLRERYEAGVAVLGEATGSKDVFAELDASGDTANIWHERTFRILKPRFAADRMQFAMDADSSFLKGDDLIWRFDPYHVTNGRTSGEMYAGLYVRYDNDSTSGVTQRIYSNNNISLRLNGDTAHAIKSVGGFVWYKRPEDDKNFRMLIMDHIMLIRIHRHIEPVVKDSLVQRADSDSVALHAVDSVGAVKAAADSARRLSPMELRDSRPSERSIHVVKEKPYTVRRKSGAGRGQGRRR